VIYAHKNPCKSVRLDHNHSKIVTIYYSCTHAQPGISPAHTTTGDREMSKVKDVFYAWASNDSGASMDIPHSRGSSKTHAIAESRRQMGSGWTIHIMRVFVDGDGQSTMGPGPEEVKKFRIR
jgi:hypothetical protein